MTRFAPQPAPPADGLRARMPAVTVRLDDSWLRATGRMEAVMLGLGGVVGGMAVTFGLFLLDFVFSMWGSAMSEGERALAYGLGISVAVVGLTFAVMRWRDASREHTLSVDEHGAVLAYPGFRAPMRIPRELVRAVTIDDRPVIGFQANERFRIEGTVPEAAFADALDHATDNAWGAGAPIPAAPTSVPVGATPEDAGWVLGGAVPRDILPGRPAWVYRPDASALPVLRLAPMDVPNLAVLFEMPLTTARAPWIRFLDRTPVMLAGGETIKGFCVRVRSGDVARNAFEPWGVVRALTADDVAETGLRPPKPLKGLRAVAFALLLLAPLVIDALSRLAR